MHAISHLIRLSRNLLYSAPCVFVFQGLALSQEPLPYVTGFEAENEMELGELHEQDGWAVNWGSAVIQESIGLNGSRGVKLEPSEPSGQISLIADRD